MLSSSDAKWRCMWYMLAWSLLMTTVSQFFNIRKHVAFFIFAGLSVVIFPIITAVYSNTSGRRGAGMIRAGYVFLDPVVACITISPIQIINSLPDILDQYHCLQDFLLANETAACLQNKSFPSHELQTFPDNKDRLLADKRWQFLLMQLCIILPVLVALVMGRRTRKMNRSTNVVILVYWLIAAIEASSLLETALICKDYEHVIFTTEAIVAIAMIVLNSYAVITLCSYLTPQNVPQNKGYSKKFDEVYKVFVGIGAILFAEIPLLAGRLQITMTDAQKYLNGTFYMWVLKDILFMCAICYILFVQVFKRINFFRKDHTARFDSVNVFFEPEKRDTYIRYRHKRLGQDVKTPEASPKTTTIEMTQNAQNLSNCYSNLNNDKHSSTSPKKAKKKVTFQVDLHTQQLL